MAIPRALIASLLFAAAASAATAGLAIGASRDDVVHALGPPRAELSAGTKMILTYKSGRIVLVDGKVARIEMAIPTRAPTQGAPRQAPARAPSQAPAASQPTFQARAQVQDADDLPFSYPPGFRPGADLPRLPSREGEWYTDPQEAAAGAQASNRRVLVLFTGSDWCPACKRFESKVANNEDFLAATRISFVLLKLDFPMYHRLPPDLRIRNDAYRRRFNISAFPTLWIVAADFSKPVAVDNQVGRDADDITQYYVEAVDEARRAKP
jgi:thiol-disulfide isomerase/thioredoxin